MIEIRDAHLALRQYIPPRAACRADSARQAGVTDPVELAAIAEAASIAAHEAGHRYYEDPAAAPEPRTVDPDVPAEVAWLTTVARVIEHDHTVAAVHARVVTELAEIKQAASE